MIPNSDANEKICWASTDSFPRFSRTYLVYQLPMNRFRCSRTDDVQMQGIISDNKTSFIEIPRSIARCASIPEVARIENRWYFNMVQNVLCFDSTSNTIKASIITKPAILIKCGEYLQIDIASIEFFIYRLIRMLQHFISNDDRKYRGGF